MSSYNESYQRSGRQHFRGPHLNNGEEDQNRNRYENYRGRGRGRARGSDSYDRPRGQGRGQIGRNMSPYSNDDGEETFQGRGGRNHTNFSSRGRGGNSFYKNDSENWERRNLRSGRETGGYGGSFSHTDGEIRTSSFPSTQENQRDEWSSGRGRGRQSGRGQGDRGRGSYRGQEYRRERSGGGQAGTRREGEGGERTGFGAQSSSDSFDNVMGLTSISNVRSDRQDWDLSSSDSEESDLEETLQLERQQERERARLREREQARQEESEMVRKREREQLQSRHLSFGSPSPSHHLNYANSSHTNHQQTTNTLPPIRSRLNPTAHPFVPRTPVPPTLPLAPIPSFRPPNFSTTAAPYVPSPVYRPHPVSSNPNSSVCPFLRAQHSGHPPPFSSPHPYHQSPTPYSQYPPSNTNGNPHTDYMHGYRTAPFNPNLPARRGGHFAPNATRCPASSGSHYRQNSYFNRPNRDESSDEDSDDDNGDEDSLEEDEDEFEEDEDMPEYQQHFLEFLSATIELFASGSSSSEPLPKFILNQLPKWTVHQKSPILVSDQKSCIICITDFCEREELLTLPCLHIYHYECIERWFQDHKTCPSCRTEVVLN